MSEENINITLANEDNQTIEILQSKCPHFNKGFCKYASYFIPQKTAHANSKSVQKDIQNHANFALNVSTSNKEFVFMTMTIHQRQTKKKHQIFQ